MIKIKHRGEVYNITPSNRKGKQYKVKVNDSWVHFGDPKMREYPGTKRGDSYCARSYGIKGKSNLTSPNFWSRKMWSCVGKRSVSRKRFGG